MKRVISSFMVMLMVLLLAGAAQAEFKKSKIAVLDFSLQGSGFETQDMGKIVAEWFITALVKEGRFEVVERNLLQKILEEQKLSLSGLLDENTATKLGKILGVKVIITGTVMKLQNVTEINARIIDVESASIIAAENVRSTNTTSLQQLVVEMSQKIIKNFPLEGYIVQRQGKNVTIDLGHRAGVKKDMEFLVYREGNVIKHPKTGEVLDVEQIETGKIKITNTRDKIAEGVVVKESKSDEIFYGQLVKSIVALKPVEPPKPVAPPAPQPQAQAQQVVVQTTPTGAPVVVVTTAGAVAKPVDSKAQAAVWQKELKSGNAVSMRDAAKRIIRARQFDTKTLDAVEDALLAGYNSNFNDRNHVDAMAWLCKALGASGNSKYADTLKTVIKQGKSRKISGYAQKSLSQL
ncbi:MAG: hypothetical protein JXR59_08795 [Desulfuromonadaceae bacterium]|nr:hypothetical protein [Desulfuromonadaceae bacterium]